MTTNMYILLKLDAELFSLSNSFSRRDYSSCILTSNSIKGSLHKKRLFIARDCGCLSILSSQVNLTIFQKLS